LKRFRLHVVVLALLGLSLLLSAGAGAKGRTGDAIISSGGCQANEVPANDDGSSSLVQLPFSINFFGQQYSNLYVNNNGNVTFDQPLSQFTPDPIVSNGVPMIAPWWGDVDTRAGNTTHYGSISAGDTQVGGHQAFCVNWIGVGYFAEHTDKLNSFQMVIVDRSDTGTGNFDIIFNYNQLQWETGDASDGVNGLGGSPARVGYTNGSDASFELPGSGQSGAFLDTNQTGGLIYNSINSQQPGRYIFPVRNGAATGHGISGTIFANDAQHPLAGAWIQACPSPADTPCRTTHSGADGTYAFINLPDSTSGGGAVDHGWTLTVNPPGGSNLTPKTDGPVNVAGTDVTGENITLEGPQPLPNGASVDSGAFGDQTSGVPSVNWEETWTFKVTPANCVGATGTATLHVQDDGYQQVANFVEGPAGTYTATFNAVYPHHGAASITYTLNCPGGNGGFDMYIDPSGVVKDTHGNPISGATVTLFRSDDPGGPFVQVPDGSAIMSPSNQANPDTTNASGHFGWDVVAGYYKVRAEKNGCTAQGGSPAYAETAVLTIPPPVTDLELVLDCSGAGDITAPTVTVPADMTAEATGAGGAVVDFASQVSASDPDDQAGPVDCQPASGSTFPLGQTTVNCSSTDTHGNTGTASFHVTVQDTTAPNLTLPPTQNANATSPAGAAVTFNPAPSATDAVDGTVTVVCTPASGASFPNGDTTVHCHATDAHSNTANGQFTVHVRGPVEQTTNLKSLLLSFSDVATSVRKSLGKKLDTVVKDLNKGPKGTKAACGQVKSFTRTVTKDIPKKIPAVEGNQLLAGIGTIHNAIGCA
jgi:hypothetical protein